MNKVWKFNFRRYNIKAIALDFDGVIVDSQNLHFKAWIEVLKKYGDNFKLKYEDITGLSVSEFIQKLNLPLDESEKIAESKREYVLQLAKMSPPQLYPNVTETLQVLSNYFDLALVTSCETDLVLFVLEYYNLKSLFAVLILEGDYNNPKPDPEPYLKCLKRLNLDARSVIAVEDSPTGIISAKKAGIFTIAISNTFNKNQLLGADLIITNFKELLNLIK